MKYLATYLLLKLGGNDHPSKEDIIQALAAVGIDADEADIDKMMEAMEGKDLDEMIAQGTTMLATFGGDGDANGSSEAELTGDNKPKEDPGEEPPEDAPNIGGDGLFGDPNDGGDY